MQSPTPRIIQLPVTMSPAVRKVDDSVKLAFVTNVEIPTEEYMVIDSYRNKAGWLMFKENEFEPTDVPKEDAVSNNKSPAQRLRSVMFVAYKNKYPEGTDFDNWYRGQMEIVINKYKETLDGGN